MLCLHVVMSDRIDFAGFPGWAVRFMLESVPAEEFRPAELQSRFGISTRRMTLLLMALVRYGYVKPVNKTSPNYVVTQLGAEFIRSQQIGPADLP